MVMFNYENKNFKVKNCHHSTHSDIDCGDNNDNNHTNSSSLKHS